MYAGKTAAPYVDTIILMRYMHSLLSGCSSIRACRVAGALPSATREEPPRFAHIAHGTKLEELLTLDSAILDVQTSLVPQQAQTALCQALTAAAQQGDDLAALARAIAGKVRC